jgi:transglutaminase/protease-like cytokinesis protein 3
MNKVESAYFIYKWIAQNIEYNWDYNIEGDILTETFLTYNEGKGGAIGISGIFKRLCELLSADSNIITGLTKITTYNRNKLI